MEKKPPRPDRAEMSSDDTAHDGAGGAPDRANELGVTRVIAGPGDVTPPPPTLSSSPATPAVQLGEFRLVQKLGEGAMGAVYKARQESHDRDVALKVLFPHVASNPRLVERLYREGRVLGQLDHPGLVQAYAVGEDRGCHYVAMEFIDGDSLQKWLDRRGRLTVADAVRLILDCARALEYAHGLGVIHRDIKPDNILITRAGQVKLADLGMAKTEDEDLALTQTGHAVGTPWYMPLEQAKNAKDIDGRSDIYALGCTLYCCLVGQPPFVARTIVEVIQAKEIGTFPAARQANPDVPERLDLVIAKMTAKRPAHRYQSCTELIRDLEALALTGPALTFLKDTAPPAAAQQTAPPSPAMRSVAEGTPDLWYVVFKAPDGQTTTRKFTTAQVQRMLQEGMIGPTARASRTATGGFRALATYKEFEGTALHLASKKHADKLGARVRNLYEQIEAKQRGRAAQEQAETERRPGSSVPWGLIGALAGAALGVALFFWFIWWVMTGLGGR